MKKIIVLTTALFSICTLNASIIDTLPQARVQLPANTLLKKSKSQRTGAVLLAGTGMTMLIIAGSLVAGEVADAVTYPWIPANDPDDNSTEIGILTIGGLAALLGSIPLYIASARNKRKYQIEMKNETIGFTPTSMTNSKMYSVGLKIKF